MIMEYNSVRDASRLPQAAQGESRRHNTANSLTWKESLRMQIGTLNQHALELAGQGQAGAAMERLREGERLLEYAAESCKDIPKQLILVVLNNMASLSQLKWDLLTTSNYLEAIIYNIELAAPYGGSCLLEQDASTANERADDRQIIQSVEYYLQYCAINSQLQRHEHAVLSVRKALRLLHPSLLTMLSQPHYQAEQMDLAEWSHRTSLAKLLLDRSRDLPVAELLHYSFMLWRADVQALRRHALAAQLRGVSIGDVMTIELKRMKGMKGMKGTGKMKVKVKVKDSVLYWVLMCSIGYFCLGTQLQLSNKSAEQAKRAHALAIVLYQLLIPFESPYLHHIRDNYVKLYGQARPNELSPIQATFKQLMELLLKKSIEGAEKEGNEEKEEKEGKGQERLKQSLRLKHICLKQVKGKQPKSNSKKSHAKSLTMSHHQPSLEPRDATTHPHPHHHQHPHHPHQQEYYKKTTRKRKERKQTQHEDFEEKYYQLAFKRLPKNSPSKKGKESVRSSSSTKDRSQPKPSPGKGRSDKEGDKLTKVRRKQRLKS